MLVKEEDEEEADVEPVCSVEVAEADKTLIPGTCSDDDDDAVAPVVGVVVAHAPASSRRLLFFIIVSISD